MNTIRKILTAIRRIVWKMVYLCTRNTTLLRCRELRPVQCLISPRHLSGLFFCFRGLIRRLKKNARNPKKSGIFMYKSCTIFVNRWFTRLIVELEGFEPSSKQGNHTLSTCLFWPLIFVQRQDPDHQSQPYPLKFHTCIKAYTSYFRFNSIASPKSFGTTVFERCLVPSPGDGIKPVIYCTSIRQRERNYFRQINFWLLRFRRQQTTLRMLTYHSNLLSNPVNPSLKYYAASPLIVDTS